jgi:ParB-like nuclease domain
MLNLRRFATAVLVVLVSVLGMGSPTVMALGDTSGPRITTDDTGAHTYDRVNPLSGPYSESALRRGPPPEVLAATLRESASVQGFGVAANSVRSAAPGVFTRTEALSGRASSRAVDEIAESMRANGWQGDPIKVVEPQGQRIVVDGHHRLAAAQRAGIDVQYEVVDPSTVIGRGMWTSVDDILQDTYTIGPNRLR